MCNNREPKFVEYGSLYECVTGFKRFYSTSEYNTPSFKADVQAASDYPVAHRMTPLFQHAPKCGTLPT